MKKIGILAAIILFTGFTSCEKDDICVDGDTALLIINFYDFEAEEETEKAVAKLRVVGEGKDTTVDTVVDRTDLKTISIPLRINETSTTYNLISNSADNEDGDETGNTDTVTFNYTTKEVYISRACGYVIHYNDLTSTLTADADNWIKNVEVVETKVENIAVTHVKIYH
ncbi:MULTISPECIES: DUF6452 family protein [unclassified Cellulophaga]|uniref:DUF6452 family protein n=1 Tax=unclassified Cellulophaga TaxID=2634405 RepID=UPI0026E2DF45|nr:MULTISPECIES: DUF6452 family protein [unclassified Cellulophaga]MDO6492047.1 DUF6452 family protein [Cellulophaga sp. 2_MG-2023]MDO6495792.1 DUF6452 family protein [Cellulophaga sp. 3_MG-2023]